jgi:multidrug transporter EmrE-like cation transporter
MQYLVPSLVLFAAVIFNVLTNVGFKYSALNEKTPLKFWGYFAIALIFGLINSILFTETLKTIPLGISSAIFFSLTVIGLVLVGHFLFSEDFSVTTFVGGGFILVGVVLIFWNQMNVYSK